MLWAYSWAIVTMTRGGGRTSSTPWGGMKTMVHTEQPGAPMG